MLHVRLLLPVIPALFALSCATAPTIAQTASPPTTPPRTSSKKHSSVPKTANVVTGEIVSLDTSAGTLTLKERTGKSTAYEMTEKTRAMKNRRPVEITAFKPGDPVVLHLRKSRGDGTLKIGELMDAGSWTWWSEMRRNVTSAKITEIGEETLTATVGTDSTPFTYTITDKTRWYKAGKEATVTDFKTGDAVTIIPRSLPGGAIMARVVADTPAGATLMKERQASSVHGVVKSLDTTQKNLTLATVAGDTRTLRYTDTTELKQGGKTLPLTALKAGLRVAARVKRDVMGDEITWRLTIEKTTRPTAKFASKSAKTP